MKKTTTTTTYECDECGKECDGRKEVVYQSGYYFPSTYLVKLYVAFGRSDKPGDRDYCLCSECKRKALEAALEKLKKEGQKERQGD